MTTKTPHALSVYSAAEAPTIDANEVAWAADRVAALLKELDPGSVAGMVLRQTLRELNSLKPAAATEVIGPIRVRMAA